jgi:hypothetical protein
VVAGGDAGEEPEVPALPMPAPAPVAPPVPADA